MRRKIFGLVVLALIVLVFLGVLGAHVTGDLAPGTSELGPVTLFDLLFYVFAAAAVLGACGVAFSRNILYSGIGLLGALLGAGSLYVFLSADFLAVTQLLVYIGGVLVLILFAVMLTNRISEVNVSNKSLGLAGGVALLVATSLLLIFVAVAAPFVTRSVPDLAPTTREIGDAFLSRWLLPFELASLILLATLVGAVVIARKELKEEGPQMSA
ncbi:MAG TPA: NADH-quinone oxidoreductase subunit J [Anaeromyxobacteraceae bacterium]|nr:NADH-quinone oxidoreductase subunit J [Anaeromyxobacteraceae bacterium]